MPERHEGMLAQIATEYYLENASKVEIAKTHGISRFQVARYLDEARREGIVTITIRRPPALPADGSELAEALGIASVTIASTPNGALDARDRLARAAAGVVAGVVTEGSRLGVSWSRTLQEMAGHLPALPGCDVVQLAGSISVTGGGGSGSLIHRLGQVAGGRTWPLPAPLIVETAETAASLRRQPEISDALHAADALDVAVVSLGDWGPGKSTVFERVTPAQRQAATAAGAVAECSGRLLAADGSAADGGLDDCVIAVTLAQLISTPQVVLVAPSDDGVAGVRAAVAAGIVNHLVIGPALAVQLAAGLGLATGQPADEKTGDSA